MRSLFFLLCLLATSSAIAHSSFESMEAALTGDLDALDRYLEESQHDSQDRSETERRNWLVRGVALRAAGRFDDAVEVWQQAAADGERFAVHVLAWHHLDREQWTEAFGWSQLSMEVTALENDLNRNQLGGLWSRYNAVQTAEGLEPSQYEAAEARAESLIETYGPSLAAERDPENQDRYPGLEPVRRSAPSHPASLARKGTPGWAYTVFEIDEEGRVGQRVSVVATDPAFARAAERAIGRWRFETGEVDEFPVTATQIIEFSLEK